MGDKLSGFGGGQGDRARFAWAFEDREVGIVWGGEVGDGGAGVAMGAGDRVMIEAAEDHFLGDALGGDDEAFGDVVAEVDQDGREEPGGPELEVDAVVGAGPEVGQTEEAFDRQEGGLDVPTAAVEIGDVLAGQEGGVWDIGQVGEPGALVAHFHQAHGMAAGIGAVDA